jgi:hypothetical protein
MPEAMFGGCYRVNGVLKREKVGRRSDAIALYQRRKSEIEQKPNCPRIFARLLSGFARLPKKS